MKRPDGYETQSYGELWETVRNLGAAVLGRGVRPGDRVGLISENRSEWVMTYLAVTCVGAVIVPYDILLKAEELGSIMRASGACMVFTSAEYLDKVSRALPPAVRTIVLFDPAAALAAAFGDRTVLPFADLVAQGPALPSTRSPAASTSPRRSCRRPRRAR
jgi:long-chain acyl-CoA synthetase